MSSKDDVENSKINAKRKAAEFLLQILKNGFLKFEISFIYFLLTLRTT